MGLAAGANVVMPNLSPARHRSQYALYDNKRCTGSESAEGLSGLAESLEELGYELCMERGDYPFLMEAVCTDHIGLEKRRRGLQN